MHNPYSILAEAEKEFDREQADKVLAVLKTVSDAPVKFTAAELEHILLSLATAADVADLDAAELATDKRAVKKLRRVLEQIEKESSV